MLARLLVGLQIQHVPLAVFTFEVLHLRNHCDGFSVRYLSRHLVDLGAVRLSHELLVLLGLDLLLQLHISQLFLANQTLLDRHTCADRILVIKSLLGQPQILFADLGLERFILTSILVLLH